MHLSYLFPVIICALFIASCGGDENPNRGKPIVLGDPSTIVTETDTQYLQDFVPEIKPAQKAVPAPVTDTATTPTATTEQPKQEEPKAAAEPEQEKPAATSTAPDNGLSVPFKELTASIPGITTKANKRQNPKNANGATYELVSGTLNGSRLKITGGNITKVSMRYQTVILIKNELGKLALESLSNTTDWETIKGRDNVYAINGLDAKHLDYIKASPSAIRNAVSRSARSKRINRKTEQKWMNSIRKVRSVNDKPMVVALRSVMWKIEGKDEKGKPYQKQLRVDIPL